MSNMRIHASMTSSKKKYLGDPEDPHFTPSSPIITRQSLTAEQEEELTRSCTHVLSEVPHSDDSEEDPLMKYITIQVANKPIERSYQKDPSALSQLSIGVGSVSSQKPRVLQRINGDSATPSETSKRNTIDRTNTSTPLTVFSESLRRPQSTRQNTEVRNGFQSSKSQADDASTEKLNPAQHQHGVVAATQSIAVVTASQIESEHVAASVVDDKVGDISISQVERNKSLPSLPHFDNATIAKKQTNGFSRMLKPNKQKRKTAAPATIAADKQWPINVQRAQTLPVNETAKKHRFNFVSLFGWGKRQLPAPAAAL